MVTNTQKTFSKVLSENNVVLRDSFVREKMNLTDDQVRMLTKYVGENVLHVVPIPVRKFYVSLENSYEYTLGYSEPNRNSGAKTQRVTFFPFFIQTSSGSFLVIASKYNIYDFLSREPYHESVGEYRYQAQLAKVLGLKNARAYNLPKEQLLDEKVVLKNDLELMYYGDDNFSFVIYSL